VETAVQHRQLEGALDLLRDELTRENYVDILRAFHDFLLPWEGRVQALLAPLNDPAIAQRRHVWRLRQDILSLTGASPDQLGIEICSALPELATTGAALGSMYVIEGSTLGGRIISAHMESRFAVTPENGCAYFSGNADQTGRMWAAFRERLDTTVAVAAQEEAIKAAVDTFDCLRTWLVARGVAQR
jgi:heme oxygenase